MIWIFVKYQVILTFQLVFTQKYISKTLSPFDIVVELQMIKKKESRSGPQNDKKKESRINILYVGSYHNKSKTKSAKNEKLSGNFSDDARILRHTFREE